VRLKALFQLALVADGESAIMPAKNSHLLAGVTTSRASS
jgi:hypothetical protein